MNNTKTKSGDSSTKIEESPKQQYVKNVSTGFIYHAVADIKNEKNILLRKGNSFTKFLLSDIKNGLVTGVWKEPNEHEIRAFVKQDNEYFQQLNYKLVMRVLLTQIMLELDDDLKQDFMDDKYIHGLLERSEKQFTRLIKENFGRMYAIDKEILLTFLNSVERVAKKLSSRVPHEFLFFEKAIDACIENPEQFTPDSIEFTKVD
jgi:hypothetical protein